MKKIKNVFLSAIHQNAGKTTVALGLFKVFNEKGLRTTFMKPVGQQFVTVEHLNVDKDSYLIGEVYRCRRCLKEMSPVTVGRGFTAEYIMQPNNNVLKNKIIRAYDNLTKRKNAIIVEGTGHAGVGAVIDLSNADVASLLGSKVIIVSEGGIGKSIDEIMLNKALFDLRNVEVIGVIVNKVLPKKYNKVKRLLKRGLARKGLDLLGVIPTDPLLSAPTVQQVQDQLKLQLLCGKEYSHRYVHNTIIAAMEPHNMMNYLKQNTLVITSGDRVDNIMVAVSSHLVTEERSNVAGIILTGGLIPDKKIIDLMKKSRIPILISQYDTYTTASKIEHLICKIQKTDKDKIEEAKKLVHTHVDTDKIIRRLS